MLLVVSQYSPFALIWMAKAFFIDWPLRIWSLYRLPKKAEGMGLRYVESDYEKEFGTIQGRMQGYAVEIKPDDHMESTIRIITGRKDSKLEVSLARPSMRPKKNIQDFTTGNWKFNLAFKTKRAPVRSIDRLSENNMKSRLILQVHDELIVEAHKEELELVKKILREEMEKAAELKVPLTVDLNSGDSWYETK